MRQRHTKLSSRTGKINAASTVSISRSTRPDLSGLHPLPTYPWSSFDISPPGLYLSHHWPTRQISRSEDIRSVCQCRCVRRVDEDDGEGYVWCSALGCSVGVGETNRKHRSSGGKAEGSESVGAGIVELEGSKM